MIVTGAVSGPSISTCSGTPSDASTVEFAAPERGERLGTGLARAAAEPADRDPLCGDGRSRAGRDRPDHQAGLHQ